MNPRILVLLLALLPAAVALWGHGRPIESPDDSGEAVWLTSEVRGAREFFEALGSQSRILLGVEEMEALDRAAKFFGNEEQVREGTIPGADPAAGAFNRRLGEQALLTLLEGHPGLVTLGFSDKTFSHGPDDSVPMPELSGSLLLRVITGPGPIRMTPIPLNLSYSGERGLITIPVEESGTTYVLLMLEDIPSGESELRMEFVPMEGGEARWWHALRVRTQPSGQLAVALVDESGGSVPCHVRLEQKGTGRLWEPPNAVDLGPIMTKVTGLPIYGPGRGYTHYIFGPFRGPFWIVPGPFETALPAGEWDIVVFRGFEYRPVRRTVTVSPGQWTRETITIERWVDMPLEGWWSGDDHVHARILGSGDADAVMAFAQASDVHLVNVLEMGNASRTWYAQRGFGPEFRVRRGDYALVPGQEDPRAAFGHIIGMNLTSLARDTRRYALYDVVADEIHRQGGLYGQTHVGEGLLGIEYDMALSIPRGLVDFNSIMQNILGTANFYPFLNLGYRITASAGSDTPYGGAVGVTRVFACLGDGVPFDPDLWFEAFRQGRTFVTNGPMLDLRVNGQGPGSEINVTGDETLKVSIRARGLAGESAPVLVELVCNGDVIREWRSTDATVELVEDQLELPAGFGFWLALRANGANGSNAHTSPVYVEREGFRHWNAAKAEEIIAAQMQRLDEIDRMATEQQARLEAGQIDAIDNWNRPIAEQADALRERTAHVRQLYRELLATLEKERPLRGMP